MLRPIGLLLALDYNLLEYLENNTVQLFNLRDDIGEQFDLSESMPDKVAELRTMLLEWRRGVSANVMPPNPNYVAVGEPVKIGPTDTDGL